MIKTRNLSFSYGKENILKDVSFSAKPGETTVVIGANGAGKSTLLKCISGLQKSGGEILVQGKSLTDIPRDGFAKAISFLDQNSNCDVALNVFEVVLLGRLQSLSFKVKKEDLDSVKKVMKLLEISRFANRYISELSGGQRQLVFIAQALVKNPEILILDEPTSALDLQHQFKLMEFLRDITKEKSFTTIITLHHLDIAAKYADNIVVIKDGKVYLQGKPEDVFSEKMLEDVYKVDSEIYLDSMRKKHVVPIDFIKN